MFKLIFKSESPEQTFQLARRLGELVPAGTVLGLSGDLGSGKTLFTKGLARGLGVEAYQRVNSPTFVIKQEYQGRLRLHHYDTYRLGGVEELEMLGFSEHFGSESVVIVEWAERVEELLPPNTLKIVFNNESSYNLSDSNSFAISLEPVSSELAQELELEPSMGSNVRYLSFEAQGEGWENLFNEFSGGFAEQC